MSDGPLSGFRVIEVAQWAFVPSAGAVLADWGADVIKVVHPESGDPMSGAVISGLPKRTDGVSFLWELANRGKRSIGIDIANPQGRAVLERLVTDADVFLTSFLPAARRKLAIDVDDIRTVRPDIVYAKGSAVGPRGPEAEDGGFDNVIYWSRSGMSHVASYETDEYTPMPAPAFGDLPSGFALASGVAVALLQRERTGKASVVDVSLLGTAMWAFGASIVASELFDVDFVPVPGRTNAANALSTAYPTKDQRYLFFSGLVMSRHWEDFCRRIGRSDLIDDPRFGPIDARLENARELIQILDEVFLGRTMSEWQETLRGVDCPWSVVQTAKEARADPQVLANEYLVDVETTSGKKLGIVMSPVQLDETSPRFEPAPEQGQQTEEILLELGYDWDEIVGLKDAKATL